MKIPSARFASTTRTKRGLGQIALAFLFLLSVLQLTHLPATAGQGLTDMWRALATGSLFLFFCVPGSNRH